MDDIKLTGFAEVNAVRIGCLSTPVNWILHKLRTGAKDFDGVYFVARTIIAPVVSVRTCDIHQ